MILNSRYAKNKMTHSILSIGKHSLLLTLSYLTF